MSSAPDRDGNTEGIEWLCGGSSGPDAEGSERLRRACAHTLRSIEDLLASSAELDPITCDPVAQSRSSLLKAATDHARGGRTPLPLTPLLRYSRSLTPAVREILRGPNVALRRIHASQRLHKIRETDLRTMQSLAKRPGGSVREKVGSSPRLLSVVREWSADRLENRLLLRVLSEMRPQLADSRRDAPALQTHTANALRIEELDEIQHLCSVAATQPDLARLPPLGRVRPNNVLLGDRRYKPVWRAWSWLKSKADDDARKWKAAPQLLLSCIYLLVLGKVECSESSLVPESFVTVMLHPARRGGFGCEHLEEGPRWALCTGDHGRELIIFAREGPFCLTAEVYAFQGDGRYAAELLDVVSGRLVPRPERAEDGRGVPFDWIVESVRGGSNAQEVFGDLDGFRRCSDQFVAAIGDLPYSSRAEQPTQWSSGSVDFTGRRVVSSTATGLGVPMVAARYKTTGTLVVGHRAREVDPAAVLDESVEQIPLRVDTLSEESERCSIEAVQRLLEASLAGRRLRSGLVAAVCDGADDATISLQRRLVPTGTGDLWLVWRSVLAAIAARDRDCRFRTSLSPGGAVIVADFDATSPSVVCLIGREMDPPEEHTPDSPWDGWYWERWAPWRVESAANPTSEQYERRCAQGHVIRLCSGIDESLADRAVRALTTLDLLDDAAIPVWPLGTGHAERRVWVSTKVSPGVRTDAARWFVDTFTQWMDSLAASGGMEATRARCDGRVQLLCIGRVFDNPEIRKLIDEHTSADFSYVSTATAKEVVEGGLIFLERRHADLPTYVDLLPDLYVEVTNARGVRRHMCLFRGRSVAPGQQIESLVEEAIVLPSGQPYYSFPLFRSEGAGTPLSFHARLESPRFPLRSPVEARIRVAFKYAQDAFRVRIEPLDQTICEPIEIQWRRGAASDIEVRNDAPPYPPLTAWEISSDISDFKNEVEAWITSLDRLFGTSRFLPLFRGNAMTGERAKDLSKKCEDLEDLCRSLRRHVSRMWQPLRDSRQCPGELRLIRNRLCGTGSELLGLRSDSSRFSRNALTLKQVAPALRSPVKRLMVCARELLASFRWDAPEGLFEELNRSELDEATKWRLMGRAAISRDGQVRALVSAAVERLPQAIEAGKTATIGAIQSAVATALWGDEAAVAAASAHIEMLA